MVAEEIPGKTPVPPQRHRRQQSGEPRFDERKTPKTQQMKRSSVGSLDVAAVLRASQAMDLIVAGHTYAETAKLVGYASSGACHNAVRRELEHYTLQSAQAMRKMHFLRIEQMYKVYHAKALKGDGWSAGRALDQLAREAKMLDLDMNSAQTMAAMPYQKRIVLEDSPAVPMIAEASE